MATRRSPHSEANLPAKRGSKPGERRGGRTKGTPNKKTVEAQQVAEYQNAAGRRRRAMKLGKEILQEFANIFRGRAAYYQPVPGNSNANEKLFLQFAALAVDAADKLAPYESPRLKAVAITSLPPAPGQGQQGNDAPGATSQIGAAEAYRLMKDGGTVTIKPFKKPVAASGG